MKKFMIAGNWKMNPQPEGVAELIEGIKSGISDEMLPEILICPPFTYLNEAKKLVGNSQIKLGAQNCYPEENGAFTGEISPVFLFETGCEFVILGHSERRFYFSESNEFIGKKITSAIKAGLKPILCIGETLDERQSGKTEHILETQLSECLVEFQADDTEKLTIAYEPVWAIGTGISATTEQAMEAHEFIRALLVDKFGESGRNVMILYGGSMNEKNASELLSQKNVEGGLIGGASLKAEQFLSIIKTADSLSRGL